MWLLLLQSHPLFHQDSRTLLSDSFAGRRHELNAHVLEVLIRFLPSVVVRQSIAWVVLTRDLVELNLPRTYLFLKPQLLYLKMPDLPTSSAGLDVDRCLHGVSELTAELRHPEYFRNSSSKQLLVRSLHSRGPHQLESVNSGVEDANRA